MSELLQNWLNNEVGLSTNITNFEKDFANGYLFGEILNKFRQQEDFHNFQNKSAYEAKLSNFKLLEPTLKALGIKFNAAQSSAIMSADRGASLRLLYQLKMTSEKLQLAADSADAPMAAKGANAPGAGVTKGIRVPREQFDSHERRFFEHRLRATGVNVKQVRVEKVTKKFVEHKQRQEQFAIAMDQTDNLLKQEAQDIHRFATRERLRQNKFVKDEWTRAGIEQWEINMQMKHIRETQEMNFAARVQQKKHDKDATVRHMASAEVHNGVDNFETGLLNLGLLSQREAVRTTRLDDSSDEGEGSDRSDLQPDRLLAATTQVASGKELAEAMEARMQSGAELEQEAGLFLRKNKESKRAGSIARKERERRRRRVLVEQQREQDMVEEMKLEEVLLEKMGRQPVEEQAISYSVWKTKRYEDVIVGNRSLRQQSYRAREKHVQQEALRQDHSILEESLEDMSAQGERERLRYRAIERGREAKLRAQLQEECEGILELVASMATAALHQEQLTDSSEVDPTLWREWMAMFVESTPVPAPEPLASEPCEIYPLTHEPPESASGILQEAALRDYVDSRGQWEVPPPTEELEAEAAAKATAAAAAEEGAERPPSQEGAAPPSVLARFDASVELQQALDAEAPELSFAAQLSREVDFVSDRPVNYRLGVVIASLLDRRHPQSPQPDPPPMPEVPLKLVMTGKPFAGKRTLATRIAQTYNLQVVDVDEVIRECLALSRRPDIGSTPPIDLLSISMDMADERCKQCEEEGNPYVRRLQELGSEVQALLDAGEAVSDELYVSMITTKIRSLFPERIPQPAQPAVADATPAGEVEVQEAPAEDAIARDAEAEAEAEEAGDAEEPAEGPADGAEAAEAPADEAGEDGDEGADAIVADKTRVAQAPADVTMASPASAPATADRGATNELEPCGWLLVGYPEGSAQLGLLERFLSGWVEPPYRPKPEAELRKSEAALLAPRPPEEPAPFELTPGGYDLHFRLDCQGDEVVRRAVGRRLDPQTALTYHLQDSPPTSKKQLVYERLVPVDDLSSSIGTLTQRVHLFDLAQDELDASLSYFGPMPDVQRLVGVDANQTTDEVYDSMDEHVAMLMERKRAKRAKELASAAEEQAAAAAAPPGSRPGTVGRPSTAPAEDLGADADAAAAPAEGEGAVEGEVEVAAAPPPPEPLQLAELARHVEKLEEPAFGLLLHQWDELQADFVESVRRLSNWHRAQLSDFRSGLHRAQQCFVNFLQRPDNKQALVDSFVSEFNSFSEEYPDMRKQDETKDELHQRADDLGDRLRAGIEERRAESARQLETLQQSQWVESQFEVVAAQVQFAVQMEASRYQSACQLLTDFYYSAMNKGLPPVREAPPKIEVLSLDRQEEEEEDPKAKKGGKKDDKKGKKGKDEPEPVELTPEEKAAQRLRRFVQEATDPETGVTTPSRWEYPFLLELMTQGKAAVWQLAEFAPPATAEKAETEAAEPKKGGRKTPEKGKKPAKGAPAEEPAAPAEPPPQLFVDLQNALLAERVTYLHRLAVVKSWAEKRLVSMTDSSSELISRLRDWMLLRRQKELDAVDGLTDALKEIIEREELIVSKLDLQGAHLLSHPNVRLRAPPSPPELPVGLEAAAPNRWTVAQLDGLLDAVSNAACALGLDGRTMPAQALFGLMSRLTQAFPAEGDALSDRAMVPSDWGRPGAEKLKDLCGLFNRPPHGGSVDCVEVLVHVALHHSPLGWPSLEALLEVRRQLESRAPEGTSWPDFWISGEEVVELSALFADPDGAEGALASEFAVAPQLQPVAFDRVSEQLLWVSRVFQRFRSPLRQQQAWEVEAAWHDHGTRVATEAVSGARVLNDIKPDVRPLPEEDDEDEEGLRPQTSRTEDDALPMEDEDTGDPPLPEPPKGDRPAEPQGLPEPPADAVSVRQLMSYLCQGATAEEGLARAVAVLGSTAGSEDAVPVGDLYACVLQLGARPTPPAVASDARPSYPSFGQFCEELGVTSPEATLKLEELTANPQFQRFLKRSGFGGRHCRAQLEKLFPKAVPAEHAVPEDGA